MRDPRSPIAALLVALILHGCATTQGGRFVWIGVDGDNSCIADVNGERFALPDDATRLEARLRDAARTAAGAVLGDRPARTRAGCWDEVMALARPAKFKRLGYVSEGDEPVEPTV